MQKNGMCNMRTSWEYKIHDDMFIQVFLPCGSLCAHLTKLFHREVLPAGLWSEGAAADPFEIYSVIDLWLSCLKFFLLCQGRWLLKTVCELMLHPGLDHRKLLAELLGHYQCNGKEQSSASTIYGLVDHTVGFEGLKYHSEGVNYTRGSWQS